MIMAVLQMMLHLPSSVKSTKYLAGVSVVKHFFKNITSVYPFTCAIIPFYSSLFKIFSVQMFTVGVFYFLS